MKKMKKTDKPGKISEFKVLAVRLPPELRDKLEVIAKSERRSAGMLARIFIEEKLRSVA